MCKNIKTLLQTLEYEDGSREDVDSKKLLTTQEISSIIYAKGLKKYNTPQKLNKRLNELGFIYKHRTDVWDITKRYEHLIDENFTFENGSIRWYSNKLNWLINFLEENEDFEFKQIEYDL